MRLRPSSFVVGLALVGVIAGAALLAPWIVQDPNRLDLGSVLAPPSPAHWLGTDGLGRDVAARLVFGARISLAIGFTAAFLFDSHFASPGVVRFASLQRVDLSAELLFAHQESVDALRIAGRRLDLAL